MVKEKNPPEDRKAERQKAMVFNLDVSTLKSPDGDYELVAKLGEGNYGAVYKVKFFLFFEINFFD